MYTPTAASPTYSPAKGLKISRSSTMETAAESPYLAKVKSAPKSAIKRYNTIQNSLEAQSPTHTDELENRIKQIDEKITKNHNYTEEKLNTFTDSAAKIDENLAAEIVSRELLEERSIKEMALIESNLALELKNEKEQAREVERKLLSQVEVKILSVKGAFNEEQWRMSDFKQEQNQLISEQFQELQHDLKEATLIREQTHNNIIKNMTNKVRSIQESLDLERKVRNETEAFLFHKIEEISAGLEHQVYNEKEKRMVAESQMLQLLEEACNKFEGQITSYRKN